METAPPRGLGKIHEVILVLFNLSFVCISYIFKGTGQKLFSYTTEGGGLHSHWIEPGGEGEGVLE